MPKEVPPIEVTLKLALTEMRQDTLRDAPDDELLQAWRRLNQWFAAARAEGKSIEDYVNAADWVLQEFGRRGFEYDEDNELVKLIVGKAVTNPLPDYVRSSFESAPGELVVVRDFVCLVGSTVQGKEEPNDLDVLFRAKNDGFGNFLLQDENVWLQCRKAFDPDKKGICHFIYNPQGAHDDFAPVYDLVLRKRPTLKTIVVKADSTGVYAAFRLNEYSTEKLAKWCDEQGLKNIHPTAKFHITTVHSKKPVSYAPTKINFELDPSTFRLGRLDKDGDALVLFVNHPVLHERHQAAIDAGASWDYDGYTPHITLSVDGANAIPDAPPDFPIEVGPEYVESLDTEWSPTDKAQPTIGDVHVGGSPRGKQPKHKLPPDAIRLLKEGDGLNLDLGCGKDKADGYVGVDLDPGSDADITWDIEKGIPVGDGSVDNVRAIHFLEHCSSADAIMKEIHRVLKPGGTFEFEVPSTKGEGAFAHPDHKTFWNKSSFAFWSDPKLSEDRPTFDVMELEEFGENDRVYVRGILRKPGDAVGKAAAVLKGVTRMADRDEIRECLIKAREALTGSKIENRFEATLESTEDEGVSNIIKALGEFVRETASQPVINVSVPENKPPASIPLSQRVERDANGDITRIVSKMSDGRVLVMNVGRTADGEIGEITTVDESNATRTVQRVERDEHGNIVQIVSVEEPEAKRVNDVKQVA